MNIDVWSDVMCPWCAVGRAHLKQALESWSGEPVKLTWRSFELNPAAPREVTGDYVKLLADKYRVPRDQAQQMIDQMAQRGHSVGVPMDFSKIRPGNTFDAHRLLHLARIHDLQDALKERLFNAYLCEGLAVGTQPVLLELATEVGLPEAEVREVLEGDAFGQEVREEQMLAQRLGVSGVPFFVIDQRLAVSGAQPPEVLLQALEHAVGTREAPEPEAAPSCDDDSCVI